MGAFGAHALREQLKRRDTTQVRHACLTPHPPPHPPTPAPVLVDCHAVPALAQRGSYVAARGFKARRFVLAV